MMFSKSYPAILATFFVGITLSFGAFACSTDGWDDVTVAGIDVGSPFGTTPPDVDGIPRFEEFCAMRASALGHVQSNAPSHSRVRARFYVYADLGPARTLADPPEVFTAYSDETGTSKLFDIAWDNGSWRFNATHNAGGGEILLAGNPGWNLIEIDWDPAGSGNVEIWLNSDATLPPGIDGGSVTILAGAPATMESIRLGLPEGLGDTSGNVYFDSVELHNETPIGALLNCDANASGGINFNDIATAFEEVDLTPPRTLSSGTPDCNSSGAVNFNDLAAIFAETL